MKAAVSVILSVLLCLSLTACGMIEPNTENLMMPPRLSAEQDKISAALTRALGTENYTLKYPVSGDFRSAFVLQNMDEEPTDEAVVFYLLSGDNTVRMNILDMDEDGSWRSVHDAAGLGSEVNSVNFSHISSKTSNNIVVSWREQGRSELKVQVYAYENSSLTALFSGSADYIHFLDIKQDGYAQMLLLGWRSQNPVAQVVRRAGPKVVSRDEIQLSPMALDFAGVKFGKTEDGVNALFIDEMIDLTTVATEVITVDGSFKLRNRMAIAEEAPSETSSPSENDAPAPDKGLYLSTIRPKELLCADLDGNGTVEIPTRQLLPGYRAGGESEAMYMNVYNSFSRTGMQSSYSTVINSDKGYYVMLPHTWKDNITVKNIPESGQWQFVMFDTDLASSTTVLLNIRVLSSQDYKDKFEENSYFLLAKRGIFEYHAAIPTTGHALSITEQGARDMFHLITD